MKGVCCVKPIAHFIRHNYYQLILKKPMERKLASNESYHTTQFGSNYFDMD